MTNCKYDQSNVCTHQNHTCIVRPGVCGPDVPKRAPAPRACPCAPGTACCCCSCCNCVDDCGESPNPGTFATLVGGTAGVTTGRPMMGIPPDVAAARARTPVTDATLAASFALLTTGRPIVNAAAAAAAAAALPCRVVSVGDRIQIYVIVINSPSDIIAYKIPFR